MLKKRMVRGWGRTPAVLGALALSAALVGGVVAPANAAGAAEDSTASIDINTVQKYYANHNPYLSLINVTYSCMSTGNPHIAVSVKQDLGFGTATARSQQFIPATCTGEVVNQTIEANSLLSPHQIQLWGAAQVDAQITVGEQVLAAQTKMLQVTTVP